MSLKNNQLLPEAIHHLEVIRLIVEDLGKPIPATRLPDAIGMLGKRSDLALGLLSQLMDSGDDPMEKQPPDKKVDF